MRTERRQELRTNELSQQIEGITQYMKRNAAAMTIIVVVAAVVVGGGYLYKNSQKQKVMDGWAAISITPNDATAASIVSRAEEVAKQGLDPKLTNAALLRVGQVAMGQMEVAKSAAKSSAETDDAEADKSVDWESKARDAYTKVASQRNAAVGALGQAYICLGILDEDDGKVEKAAEWYKKIVDDERFAATPFATMAQYRLDNLDKWAQPIVFAPAPEAPPAPLAPAATSGSPIQVTPVGQAAQPAVAPATSKENGEGGENITIGQLKQHEKPAQPAEKPAEAEKPVQPAESATDGESE